MSIKVKVLSTELREDGLYAVVQLPPELEGQLPDDQGIYVSIENEYDVTETFDGKLQVITIHPLDSGIDNNYEIKE